MKTRIAKAFCSAVVSLNMIASATISQMPVNALTDTASEVQSDDGFKPALINLKPAVSTEETENTEVKNSPMFEGMETHKAEKLAEENDISALPATFDLRDKNKVSPVADQNPYGTCWSFGAIASAESDLIDLYPDIDLSELHTAYFPFSGNGLFDGQYLAEEYWCDILDIGGNLYFPINVWSQWIGPVYEETLPYYDAYLTETPEELEQYRNLSDFHMQNAHYFNYADRRDYENREAVNKIIKDILYNGNVVNATYAHWTEDIGGIYNGPEGDLFANHSIAIVGWDDNYSKDNFNSEVKPEHDGAWIIKNSWGTEDPYHVNGYTWISYDELSLGEFAYFEMESADKYDNNNYYDSLGFGASFTANEASGVNYEATMFRTEGGELLKAISTMNVAPYTKYEVTVYTDITDESDPTSGTAHKAASGTLEESGYFTIELDTPVLIENSQTYSVVVKLENKDYPYVIPAEAYIESTMEYDDGYVEEIDLGFNFFTYDTLAENTEEGVSFFSTDGADWTDTALYTYDFTETEKNEILDSFYDYMTPEDIEMYMGIDISALDYSLVLGNINLKAITTDYDRVSFSHDKAVPLNEKVSLSSDNGADVFYSVNGGEYQVYEEPFAVTEETVITAYTSGSDYICTRTLSPAKSALTDFSYGVIVGEDDVLEKRDCYPYETEEGKTAYSFVVTADIMDSIIPMFSTPSTEFLVNGEAYSKGDTLDLTYGQNYIDVTLCGTETHAAEEIILDVYVTAAVWSYTDEMLISDENTVVTLSDGTVLEHFVPNSVSDYAGEEIHVAVYDNAGNIIFEEDTYIPGRNIMSEISLNYIDESIDGFSDYDLENLFISINDEEFVSIYETDLWGWYGSLFIEPDTKYAFKLPLVEGVCFESEAVVIETPARPEGPEELIYELDLVNEMIIFGNTEENLEYAYRAHYEPIETYEDLYAFYEKIITEEDLELNGCETIDDYIEYSLEFMDCTIEELIETQDMFNESFSTLFLENSNSTSIFTDDFGFTSDSIDYDYAVRYAATETAFASEYTHARVTANRITDEMLGDIDCDGVIDASDASLILKMYTEISTGKDVDTNSAEYISANVDKSLAVDASDASYVLSYYVYTSTGGSAEDFSSICEFILNR